MPENIPTIATTLLAEGIKAWSAKDHAAAQSLFAQAAKADPMLAAAHMNLGVALRRASQPEAAVICYRRALALEPNNGGAHSNLGNALRDLGQLEQAELHARLALSLHSGPPNHKLIHNLAVLLRDRRQTPTARHLLAELARLQPNNPEYAWDLALTDLYLTDYLQGFAGYEARLGLDRNPFRGPSTQRLLPGMNPADQRVVVLAEQGFGDALQFARFLPRLAEQCQWLAVECLPELLTLFETIPGVAQVFPRQSPIPDHDVWIPMMSLAQFLGLTWADLPSIPTARYLTPPQPWGKKLDRPVGQCLNVGLIWAGKLVPRDRSWPLEVLLPLLDDPRLSVYSLQLGPRRDDLTRLGVAHLVHDLSDQLTSFADTAAVMDQMDLVITVDTSAAHLSAALGRPTWMLLRYVSDWRWRDDGETCPWYPTMRLFRQPHPDDFHAPVAQLRTALTSLTDQMQIIVKPG